MRTFTFAVHVPSQNQVHPLAVVRALDAESAIDYGMGLFSPDELLDVANRYGIPRVTGHDGLPVTDAIGKPMYVSYIDTDFLDDDEPASFVCIPHPE
jgi:hypothetical protein